MQTSVEFANSKPESIYLGFPFLEKSPPEKKVTRGSKYRNEVANFRELSGPGDSLRIANTGENREHLVFRVGLKNRQSLPN